MTQKSTIRDGGPCPLRDQGERMQTEWVLLLILATGEPYVEAKGFETSEQCLKAGEIFQEADKQARGKEPGWVMCEERRINTRG